jgi:hypothetical protein
MLTDAAGSGSVRRLAKIRVVAVSRMPAGRQHVSTSRESR